jgi:hypothetical protein
MEAIKSNWRSLTWLATKVLIALYLMGGATIPFIYQNF